MTARKGAKSQSSPVIEKQFESLVRAATDAILGIDHEGRITIWNKAATKMFGYKEKEAIGKDLHDLLVPARLLVKAEKGFNDFLKTGKGPLVGKATECVALRKDGSEFPIELSITGFRQDDHWHATGIIRDIAKRKQAEERVSALSSILEKSLNEIYIFDAKTLKFIQVNYGARVNLGYKLDELSDLTPLDLKPEFTKTSFEKLIKPLRTGKKEKLRFTSAHRRKDGSLYPVEVNLQLSSFESREVFVAIILDITERKQAEEKLRESEKRYRNLVNYAPVCIHQIDMNGKIVSMNAAGLKMANLDCEEDIIGQEYLSAVSPEDQDRVGALLDDTFEGKTSNFEFTGSTLLGRKIYSSSLIPIPGPNGKIEKIMGVTQDITVRRQSEEVLQRERNQTRQIIDTARDAFVGMDMDGIITDWNPQAEKTFGWAGDKAIGRELAETIIPEALREAHKKGLKHYLASGEGPILNQHIEITALHRDGHAIPVELSIVAVKEEGSSSFNAFIRDISKRAKAQEELKESHEQLRASLIGTIVAVSKAIGARDPYTAGHQQRVSQLSRCIAQEMGMDAERIDGLRMGASVHDIGKIYLPAEILAKPSQLTELEYKLVQSHSQVGYDILKDVTFPWPVADIAWQHHERLDGSGYPQGLKGNEIGLEARIVAVADVVEAISSHRPYRASLGMDAALEEIKAHRGTWFDPDVVDACLKLFREKKFSFGGSSQTHQAHD